MTLDEMIERLSKIKEMNPHSGGYRIVVPIKRDGFGGTPCEDIVHVSTGFDWDNGKIFIAPECKLIDVKS